MTRKVRLAIILTLLVAALAACGAGAEVFSNVGQNLSGGDGERAAFGGTDATRDEGAAPAPGEGSGTADHVADLAERRIVKTGEITLEVQRVSTAVGLVRALAVDLDGYVGGSSAGETDEAATLTLRIPADRFDVALERLRAMDATVLAEATTEEDVTSAIVDLDARIGNLEASEVQYRALIERAERIDDVLAVQRRLDDVRGEIERLKAQLEQLSGLADLATLTVTLVPPDELVERTAAGWDAGSTLEQATAALVSLGQGLATVAIWAGVVGLPILIGVGLLALVGLRLAPRLSGRRSGSSPTSS